MASPGNLRSIAFRWRRLCVTIWLRQSDDNLEPGIIGLGSGSRVTPHTPSSSTSNSSVALGGITPPAPRAP